MRCRIIVIIIHMCANKIITGYMLNLVLILFGITIRPLQAADILEDSGSQIALADGV